MDGQPSVLIVDPSQETREVLQTALERRGVRILSASRPAMGLELARRHQVDLIVLDLEPHDSPPEEFPVPLAEQCRRCRTPMIFLGSVRRSRDGMPEGEFVAKPYHYAPLIRRIEELLDECVIGEPRPCHRCS